MTVQVVQHFWDTEESCVEMEFESMLESTLFIFMPLRLSQESNENSSTLHTTRLVVKDIKRD